MFSNISTTIPISKWQNLVYSLFCPHRDLEDCPKDLHSSREDIIKLNVFKGVWNAILRDKQAGSSKYSDNYKLFREAKGKIIYLPASSSSDAINFS